jgi:hypothetical protein
MSVWILQLKPTSWRGRGPRSTEQWKTALIDAGLTGLGAAGRILVETIATANKHSLWQAAASSGVPMTGRFLLPCGSSFALRNGWPRKTFSNWQAGDLGIAFAGCRPRLPRPGLYIWLELLEDAI